MTDNIISTITSAPVSMTSSNDSTTVAGSGAIILGIGSLFAVDMQAGSTLTVLGDIGHHVSGNLVNLDAAESPVIVIGETGVISNTLADAVGGTFKGSALIDNKGSVYAFNNGISIAPTDAGNAIDIINDGTIHAQFTALDLDVGNGGAELNNSGEIYAEFIGISVKTGAAFIVNSGNIAAMAGIAMDFLSTRLANIINTGDITGQIGTGSGDDLITNAGRIFGDIASGSGNDHVINSGTIHGDIILGNGNDTFDGRHGILNGSIVGGAGNDTYIVDDSSIAIFEGPDQGIDRVETSSNFALGGDLENLVLTGAGNTHGIGNELDNIILGNSGDNVIDGNDGADGLDGGSGNDLLRGGGGLDELFGDGGDDTLRGGTQADSLDGGDGDDLLIGDAGIDTLLAGDDNDELRGGANNDQLLGGAGDDRLFGGTGGDRLFGGTGDDTLHGGAGKDFFTGGTGADTFAFNSIIDTAVGAQRDVITDFHATQGDVIDLSAIDANANTAGDNGFILVGAYSNTAGELRITIANGNSLIHGDTDGDGVDDFQISVHGATGLSAADFFL